MKIGKFDLDKQVLVVAEVGNNHEGNFALAQEMVRRAAECGVGAVKFQTFRADHFVSRTDTARYNRLRSFELTFDQFAALAELARSRGLLFLSTPLDLPSAAFLEGHVDAFKIASGDNNFYPLLEHVARSGKPIIVSTGASDLELVRRAVVFVRTHAPNAPLAVLHCVSAYPTEPGQVNLRAIPVLAAEFGVTVGYSDHTLGIEAAVLSVALGARIIEKHFTLDKQYSDFRDHQLSADVPEMRELVEGVRRAELLLGRAEKSIQSAEATIALAIRRSIVAGKGLARGHRIAPSDLMWIRPGGGLAPGQENLVVGKVLRRDVGFGERLTAADLEAA